MLAMSVKGIPYSWVDTATQIYSRMFAASEIAKHFSCKRNKASSCIVSDGLGLHFKKLVVDELLNKPGVFYAVAIDETPLAEQRCLPLDVIRYFSNVASRSCNSRNSV